MGLTVIAGRSGSGKSRLIHERIGAAARSGRPALLIVPEQYTLEAERSLIATLGVPGLLSIEVMSPTRLIEDVFSRVGGPRDAVIDRRGKAMALRRAAEDTMQDLSVFGSVAARPGFAAGMADLLADLKNFDVTPDRLLAAAQGDELLPRKLRDVAALYRAFDAFLAGRRYMDAEDRMAAFIDTLPRAQYLRGTPVFVDAFDYLPPRTVRMLGALLQVCGDLTVALTLCADGDPDALAFEAGRHSLEALRDMAERAGHPVRVERVARPPGSVTGRAPEIDHLERWLYAYPAPVLRGTGGAVRLLEAATPEDEVESAAGCVARLVREEGLRWRDIAVVCGDLAEYAPRVARIFARHGVPVFLDNRRPVLHHPAVTCLLAALRVVARNYRAQDLLTLLKSGYAGIPDEGVEIIERYLLQFGIRGRAAIESRWLRGGDEYDLAALNGWRERIAAPLMALSRIGRKAQTRQWAEGLYALLDALGVDERLREESETLRDSQPEWAALSAQVWNAMMDMLDQAEGLLGDMEFTASEVADLLETGFAAAEVGILPTGSDLVLVGDVGRTKLPPVRHLIVLGAVEGSLPATYAEGMVFHDRELARLSDAGLTLGRPAAVRIAQSRHGVYAALSKPAHGLWLYWPLTDGMGGARLPSPLISRVGKLLGIGPEKAPTPGLTTPAAAMGPLAAGFRALRAGQAPGAGWAGLAATLARIPAWQPRLRAMASLLQKSGAERPQGLLPAGTEVSVSQLEKYALCPFSWYVEYALRPCEWKQYGVALSDTGTFVHKAAAALGRKILGLPDAALTDEAVEALMDNAVSELMERQVGTALQEDGRGRWMARRMRAACRLAAQRFARQLRQGSFRPAGFEIGFGSGKQFPHSERGGIALSGFVDRVDVFRNGDCDYLRVIDYKTGNKKPDLAGAKDGYQVQLWVYLIALCAGWPHVTGRTARPAGAYYFIVQDDYVDDAGKGVEANRAEAGRLVGLTCDDPRVLRATDRDLVEPGRSSGIVQADTTKDGRAKGATLIPADDMNALLRGVGGTVERIVSDIRRGFVEPQPMKAGNKSVCAHCPYRPVCGSPEPVRHRFPSKKEEVRAWIEHNRKEANPDA
ncbi:MAG: PD-(D/E)XK nuclease family protein [Christensenellales bacterium]|jgi:ATP-dependent helicase/nuclease subunit B